MPPEIEAEEPENETDDTRTRRSPDPELSAMRRILDILSDQQPAARARIVAYVASRFTEGES